MQVAQGQGPVRDCALVQIEEQEREQVNTMKYLGVLISSIDGSMEKEVQARTGSAT